MMRSRLMISGRRAAYGTKLAAGDEHVSRGARCAAVASPDLPGKATDTGRFERLLST
jgi:hypothetical protein